MNKVFLRLSVAVLLMLAASVAALVWSWRPTVATAAAKRARIVDAVPASVEVRAEYALELRSENAGRVRQSSLAPGKLIRAGDELVQIDDTDLQLELEKLDHDLATARRRQAVGSATELELLSAREKLAQAERQHRAGDLALQGLQLQRRAVQQLEQTRELERIAEEGELAALETAQKAKRREIEKTRLIAPIDGQVIEVHARPGELIAPGAMVARLLAKTRVVEAKIAEENFARVRSGQLARVRFLGYGEEQFAARVTEVLPSADAATRRYTAHLEVEIAPERLVPGSTGEAVIVVGSRENAIVVPRRALTGSEVLVVEDGRVQRRRVQRGFVNPTEVEILSGLAEGELVIVEQLESFREGDRVKLRQR